MKWAHLPVAGGLYDQHPQLIDEWDVLFRLDAEYTKRKQDEDAAKAKMGR